MTSRLVSVGTGLVAGSALVAFVAATTALVWSSETAAPGTTRTVAFVNGTAIFSDDLDLRLSQILPLASFHGNLPPAQLLSLKRAALDELVLDELIYREAAAAGHRPSPAAVDTEVSSARARFDSEEAFAAALRENGLDEAAFRERLGRAVVVRDARDARSRPESPRRTWPRTTAKTDPSSSGPSRFPCGRFSTVSILPTRRPPHRRRRRRARRSSASAAASRSARWRDGSPKTSTA